MTKVVYIISVMHRSVFFEHTADRLRNAGIDMTFIMIDGGQTPLSDMLIANGFKVYFVEAERLLFSWKAIGDCVRILKDESPQLVHCHFGKANFIGLISAFISRVPIRVYTRHQGQLLTPTKKELMLDHLQNKLATHIIAITEVTKQLLIWEGVKEEKIKIVHHGFDIEQMMNFDSAAASKIKAKYNPEGKYPVVGVIARWLEWKGIHYVISAFKELLKEYPNAKLCLFNITLNSDYSNEISRMLSELPAGSYEAVEFEDDIYNLYRLFDMYVHVPVNPYCEAFGQIYIEALASGVPSIFTLSGIAREFISEDNAFIVDFKNSDQIFEKMNEILSKQKDMDQLLKNGQEVVKRMFTVDVYMSNLLAAYRSFGLNI